jgi:hypothetical protein
MLIRGGILSAFCSGIQSYAYRAHLMKPAAKSSLLFLLIGVLIGALLMRVATSQTPTTAYRSVIASLHFLLREGDAASARAAFDSCVPSFFDGESYLSPSELTSLDQALRQAATKHVE